MDHRLDVPPSSYWLKKNCLDEKLGSKYVHWGYRQRKMFKGL